MTQILGNLFIDGKGKIEDSSIHKHVVTVHGNAAVAETTSSKLDTSIYFDGINDYLLIPHHNDFNFGNEDFTIDVWCYNMSFKSGVIISKDTVIERSWLLRFNGPTSLSFGLGHHNIFNQYTAKNIKNSLWFWHHIAVSRHSKVLRLFYDGKVVGKRLVESTINYYTQDVRVGVRGDGYYDFTGYIDNIRIVKGAALWSSDFDIRDNDAMFYKCIK